MDFVRFFEKLESNRSKALIPYFTAHYPSRAVFEELVIAAGRNGADIIEIGLPFSDPLADGPVIQHSSQQALKNGFTIKGMFRSIDAVRCKISTPLVIMTYLNPVLRHGLKKFISECARSGVSGLIIPDLVPEEGASLREEARRNGIAVIHLMAPTTPEDRMRLIASKTTGFIYLVSVAGVTGQRKTVPSYLPGLIKKIKTITDKPVCVGFGISTPAQAKAVARYADGIIIGSAVVKKTKTEDLIKLLKSFYMETHGNDSNKT